MVGLSELGINISTHFIIATGLEIARLTNTHIARSIKLGEVASKPRHRRPETRGPASPEPPGCHRPMSKHAAAILGSDLLRPAVSGSEYQHSMD